MLMGDGVPGRAAAPRERGALYRAYRSLTFGEVAGQHAVRQTLLNAVRYGSVGQAYLFTGPRGTGKTSTARILARAVNCLELHDGEPCNRCAICVSMLERRSLDLVEIDGASNNSVDDVRELISRVNFRPAEARRKVFIIDEVHMLSIGAFNALLKTLEEPPEHILFLLATTEIHKVPATVTSRCQVFALKPIAVPEVVGRLAYICEREGIVADRAVLQFIARQSTGSLRDALSLLEQIRAYCGDTLQIEDVEAALGMAREGQVAAMADAMARGDLGAALLEVGTLSERGLDARQLARQLTGYWSEALNARARRQPIAERHVAAIAADGIAQVLRSLLVVESAARRSDSPRWALELAIAEATLALGKGRAALPEPVIAQAVASQPATEWVPDLPRETPAQRNGAPASGDTKPRMEGSATAADGALHLMDAARDGDEAREAGVVRMAGAAAEMVEVPESAAEGRGTADGGGAMSSEGPDEPVRTMNADDVRARWPRVLQWLSERQKTNVKGYLSSTTAQGIQVEGESIVIGFPGTATLLRAQIERPANRAVIEQAVKEVFGSHWTVRCATIEGLSPPPSAEDLESDAMFIEQQLRIRRAEDTGV